MYDSNIAKLGLLGLLAPAVLAAPHIARQSSLDDWLTKQETVAVDGVLANIGPDGSKVSGAAAGVVVASPSKSDPDYFYTWTRDAALTIKALVDRFLVTKDSKLEDVIKAYLTAQGKIQNIDNPSGGISTGGLGEPKFEVNLTAFTGAWGRPQRDGPALRATALIAYSRYLMDNGDADTVKSTIWPIVSADLGYVTSNWNQTGFDLWEEVNGTSFFTLIAQHRSLIEGSKIAGDLQEDCTNCDTEAPKIRCVMSEMWNGEGYMMADVNANNGRSGKGTQTMIASNHGFDENAGCEDNTFQPCSAKALSNLKVVADSFSDYQINSNIDQGGALALGRYNEDVYQNGNPWYLTTTAAAEQLYLALATWDNAGSMEVTDVSKAFFQAIYSNAATGTYKKGSDEYTALTAAVKKMADGYMAIVQKYVPEDGSMAEQYSKSDGSPLSAADLTWSYAALLTAKAARDGNLPPGWGADKANTLNC